MKIQFLKNLADCKIPKLPEDTYVIYKDGYEVPDIEGIRDKVEFEEFKKIYQNIHANMFIVFGLNRIITPSNRCDFIFEHLFTLSADVEKISIDYLPFIGEPWRLWFHYGLCQCGNFGIPYSYSIETEWKHWFYRNMNDSRFEASNIGICISDTYSDLDLLEHNVDFVNPSNDDLEWYEEAKAFVFEKYNTPKLLINNLLKLANKRFEIKYTFDSYKKDTLAELPDLNIYRFVSDENMRRLETFNKIVKTGRGEH